MVIVDDDHNIRATFTQDGLRLFRGRKDMAVLLNTDGLKVYDAKGDVSFKAP